MCKYTQKKVYTLKIICYNTVYIMKQVDNSVNIRKQNMSFADLKTNRNSSISKLVQAAEKANGASNEKSYDDDRVWKPSRDKAGNGYAVVRFLPAGPGEDLPWVKYWDHGFQGPTGLWYIENSLSSIGQSDPVGDYNSKLWNSGLDEDKAQARKQKRRLHYAANVLIVSDPENPQNEGKVKIYKFGRKIFDKIMDMMQPQFQDEEPVNPFDFWEGADFKIKIRKVEGWVNYDKSEFSSPAPLFNGDEERLESVYNQLHPLNDFLDPKNYKSYDELQSKLNKVLGIDAGTPSMEAPAPAPVMEAPEPSFSAPAPEPTQAVEAEEDDTLSYFEKLAQQG